MSKKTSPQTLVKIELTDAECMVKIEGKVIEVTSLICSMLNRHPSLFKIFKTAVKAVETVNPEINK